MTTPTNKELRELDEWIAVNLFNKHGFEPHPINNSICEVCNKTYARDVHLWPNYTADPEDVMQVLEKCAVKCSKDGYVHIELLNKEWQVGYGWGVDDVLPIGQGETLPLAICIFARQLFSKESK